MTFNENDDVFDKKPYTYFEWINNYSDSPTQESTDVETSLNSNGNTQYTTNESVRQYFNNRNYTKLILTESFIVYGTKYDTEKNFLSSKQTTSLLNTPYFINSLMKGVEKEKNDVDNPYTALGYLYLNSYPYQH